MALSNHASSGGDGTCPQCDSVSVTTTWHHDVFDYGSGESAVKLHVDLPVRRCASCDFEFLDHEGHWLRHEAVCRHLGVLSPDEVRGIRNRYEMKRSEFAQVTGLGEATLNRWENGTLVQNRANDRYLRLLAMPEVMSRLTQLLAPDSVSSQAPASRTGNQFRLLEVSEQHRRAQQGFKLRLAS